MQLRHDSNKGIRFVPPHPILLPNFAKALPFAFVVAKNMDIVALAQPAVELGKKLTPLRFGDLRVGRSRAKWTEGIQALELKIRGSAIQLTIQFAYFEKRHTPAGDLFAQAGPIDEERIAGRE